MHNIINSWFVQGMIKATSDAWLKGWDERNGGNLTLHSKPIFTPSRAISP